MNTWNRLPFHVAKGAEKNDNIYLKAISETYKKTMPGRVYWEDIVANADPFGKPTSCSVARGRMLLVTRTSKPPRLPTPWPTYTRSPGINLTWAPCNWREQSLAPTLTKELAKGLQFVYEFLNDLSESLISEAAKYERTWDALRQRKDHPFDLMALTTFMASEADRAARYALADEDADKAKNHSMLHRVTDMGTRFWNGLKSNTN